ncbi:MAG: nucleoside triphosphate pyrophosphohydrolase [Bacteroidales bacterium]|jgi:XTP/dITP diphosphohydrolase|nr:nucleoside triphosphate pyrophosphohydrolase [Bacteroidales bacterium]MBO7545724.1 nucleoside triphosphate pyrophosphohydrolase [Paludibacteraceae bacterium]MBQ7672642.1 nucleoside triphosphate pyrophosphohydrolase [Paludibacteraceae bacterium]MBR4460251.1 nucleoside triphosphate pyrophosphohydrolase [Paludibacteraceae bacterium]
MSNREEQLKAFDRLLTVMDELREGCPWDRKQTFDSLRENTLEETYELASAITSHDMNEIAKELGDVLLHVVFYAKMGSEQGQFDIADVCNKLCDKLIFRHPHVYGVEKAAQYGNLNIPNAKDMTDEDVKELWEKVKQREKDGNKTILSGVPKALPSLIKAYRIQEKAANAGFDWDEPSQVWDKVKEEISEFEDEAKAGNQDRMEAELGDVLFAIVNAARLYHLIPDNALERTNQKFIARFTYLEQRAKEQGRLLDEMTLDEMEAIWQESKKLYK